MPFIFNAAIPLTLISHSNSTVFIHLVHNMKTTSTVAQKKPQTTCFVCFFKPALVFCSLTVTPLRYTCPHGKKPSKISFETSPIHAFISFLLCVTVTGVLVETIRDVFTTPDLSVHESYLAADDVLMNTCASSLYFISFLLISQKAVEMQSFAEIVHDGEQQGLVYLDAKFVKNNTYIMYVSIMSLVLMQAATMITFVLEGVFTRTRIRILFSDTIELLEGCLVLHYYNLMITFPRVFARLFLQAKYALKNRLDEDEEVIKTLECSFTPEEENDCQKFVSSGSLEQELRDLRRIYSSITLSYLQVEKYLSPTFLIWWLTMCFSVTIKAIICIKCIEFGIEFTFAYVMRMIKIAFDLVTVVVFFQLVETVATMVSYAIYSIHVTQNSVQGVIIIVSQTLRVDIHQNNDKNM